MESDANMRFVRCPKCSELLPEFSNVSIYQCGGCNTILRAKNYTSNNEKTIIDSSETNSYHEKDESTDVALEITSVFSLSMKDENWSYQNNSRSSSFENFSQASNDKCDLGSPGTKKRNDSSMQNTSPGEENEYTGNSFSSSNQNSKSNREIVFGVHSRNSSISTNRKSKKLSLGSESFYSARSRFEYENEVMSFDSPSTSFNNRMELLKTAEKLKNRLESVCKTTEQNKRMYRFLIENANSGSSKRYVLPVSKGAPFVICYKCFEMLHIPVYFLKKTRRSINKLKCGSCLEVLRLQLPFRSNEKLRASTENANFSENVDSASIECEVFVCDSSGAEIEPELQASKDAPKVKCTLHQLMGYLSARMLLQ